MGTTRVSTGIPGLDDLIEGGFPAKRTILISGPPGSGKSIFCLQYLLGGLKKGEKAVYVAVDQKPADVLEQSASLGWDLSKYVEKKDLLVLDSAPYFTSRQAGSNGREVDIQKFAGDLNSYIKRMGASRVAIDTVAPVIFLRESIERNQEQVRRLVHFLESQLETTNLITCYPLAGSGEETEHGLEEYLVTGVIVLQMGRENNCIARTISIRKMRFTALDLTEAPFSIVKGNGIMLWVQRSRDIAAKKLGTGVEP